VAEFVAQLEALTIVADEEVPGRTFRRVLDLARSEHLTGYDAAYLELSMRLGVPLATKDQELGKAAERLGIQVLWAT
jgi:predicted nucleic acid-binding protein